MTFEQISSSKPGRELDYFVAEYIMGYEWWVHAPNQDSMHPGKRFLRRAGPWLDVIKCLKATGKEPVVREEDERRFHVEPDEWSVLKFSTRIGAAWKVIGMMYSFGFKTKIESWDPWTLQDRFVWTVVLSKMGPFQWEYKARGEAEAICKAALCAWFNIKKDDSENIGRGG